MDGQSDYIGNMGGSGATGMVGQIDYAAAAPGSKGKAVGAITERDIARIRARGGLYKLPRVMASNGRSGGFPGLAGTQGAAFVSRALVTIGPEAVYTRTGDGLSITAAPLAVAVNFGSALILEGTLPGTSPTTVGLSFAKEELHVFVSSSGPVYSLLAGAPPPANFVSQTGWTNGAPFAPTAYTSPGAGYNQVCYGLGKYVSWQQGGGAVLKYSSDRLTWTNCPVAGLNADGGAAGDTFAAVRFDEVQQIFIAVSVYGEIETSSDGITFTKTFARAGGGTTQGIEDFCVTKDGATATDVQTCFSRDERLTYEFFTGGATSNTTLVTILAAAGVAAVIDNSTGSALTDRVVTDWGNAVASAIHNDFYTLPAGAGTKLNAYVRTA